MTRAVELAEHIARLVERYGVGGSWVVTPARQDGLDRATVRLIDAAEQRSYLLSVLDPEGATD